MIGNTQKKDPDSVARRMATDHISHSCRSALRHLSNAQKD